MVSGFDCEKNQHGCNTKVRLEEENRLLKGRVAELERQLATKKPAKKKKTTKKATKASVADTEPAPADE